MSSRKVMKLSSANNDEIKQDFISKLPDTLLTRILSLLPDADACRTSVLSKSWKDLWMFLPNLHFVIPNSSTWEQASNYYDLVDKTLAIRGGLPIRRFFLYGSQMFHIACVENWLRIAVQRKVQIIVLRFPPCGSWVSFHWDMFKTCETLVELTLEGQFCLEVPKDKVFFPCLKKISLVSIRYGYRGDESFENLITTCCPVLEELFLERQKLDYFGTIKISSISLKRLRIYNTVNVFDEFVIDAPKLEYLNIEDKKGSEYSDYSFTKKPSSLVEAYIDTDTDSVNQIVTNISAVKVLTLTFPTIWAFNEIYEIDELDDLNRLNVPVFPNLVKLVIDVHANISNWSLLFVFLHNMPNLGHLTFMNGLLPIQNAGRIFHQHWKPPPEAPACLRFKLKEIIILNREAITQEELTLIWYMLNHSDNLEILTVNGHELDPMRLEVLLKFHRGSNLCRFEIV
ncbi:F-box/RNI-like/FBD-like domains-containing protein [Artemisia annua]|uniref:F-box/RNI-like/FBD-like domains-containing protein n=1 Tax=Artemisia annua TaxID=35608 RepID=A0A2U1KKJ4_ARTAN|nr:F-box/RNI-like/FBD-like domains-containing protein [Artemisia annua]